MTILSCALFWAPLKLGWDRNPHDTGLTVVALLPMFPIRHTTLTDQSLRVSHGRSGPSFKTWFPTTSNIRKSMRGKRAGFGALQASVPWVYPFIHFQCLVQVNVIYPSNLAESQAVKAQRYLSMNPRCWTRESAVSNCKPLRPSSQHRNLDSKGQSKQTEYIDVSVYEINTKLM